MFNLYKLTERLYPKGRAFKILYNSVKFKFHKALAISEQKALDDAISVLDTILPDNNNFTSTDCDNWERRLGMTDNSAYSTTARKQFIVDKINAPGDYLHRQSALWLQQVLLNQSYISSVTITENRFGASYPYTTKTPASQFGVPSAIHQTTLQHNQVQHGKGWNMIVNSLDNQVDSIFNIGGWSSDNLKNTFFISGVDATTPLSIPASKEKAFRRLVLQVKPTHTIAFLLVNYT